MNLNHRSLEQSLPSVRRTAGADWMSTTLKRVLLAAAIAMPSAARAVTLRSPQVTLGGTGLQSFLNSVGETIDAQHDQIVGELLQATVSNNSTYTLQIELGPATAGTVLGVYSGHDANPTLMPVFPAAAAPQWFATISYRTGPGRATVNLFDDFASFRGTTVYLGADRNAIGFYVAGPSGTYYSQDSRNPDGAAQCLFFRGTGINSGTMWLAFEEQPYSTGDHDFDDAVCFVETVFSSVTPTLHTTWGQLKQRFR